MRPKEELEDLVLPGLSNMQLVLASKSPRRKEILEGLGIKFTVITQDTDESCTCKVPELFVEEVAKRKGAAITEECLRNYGMNPRDCLVLSADTIVACDDYILGKPHDAEDGARMLHLLSGRRHRVVSGFSIHGYTNTGIYRQVSSHTVTWVDFADISENDLQQYLVTSEPYDKAGGYAIQGHAALWIKGIEGCYYNVVGLPIYEVANLIKEEFGFSILNME